MTSRTKTILVVGVDFSDAGDIALTTALGMARGRDDIEVHAAHIVTDDDLGGVSGADRMSRIASATDAFTQRLSTEIERIREREAAVYGFHPHLYGHLRFGDPATALHQVAVDYSATLLIVGTHDRSGLERMLIGSVAEKLVRRAHLPVLVARPNTLASMPKTDQIEPPRAPSERPGRPRPVHVYVSTKSALVSPDVDSTGLKFG